MIAIKYAKRYPLSMISQSDMLNVIKRILTRAGVKVEYSAGFNPHMLLYFSPALSLGIESECEYVCAAAGYAPDLIEKLNDAAPSGFECRKVFSLPCEPNLTARSYAAHYVFKARGLGKQKLSSIAGNPDFTVLFKDKNGEKVKSAGEKIYMLKAVGDDAAEAVLACGNDNLRADRVLKQLCADFSLDWDAATVTKIRLLLDGAEDADEFLLKLQKNAAAACKN